MVFLAGALFWGQRIRKARWFSPPGFQTNPAITYSRANRHYHGPWMLNGRVRNGNGCGHPGMLTGKLLWHDRPGGRSTPVYQLVAARVASARANSSQREV